MAVQAGLRLFGSKGWTHSDWISFAVAAGTLTLAGVTWRLARATRQDVNTSRKIAEATVKEAEATLEAVALTRAQVETSQASLNTAIRPLLVDVPWGIYSDSSAPMPRPQDASIITCAQLANHSLQVRVPLRNVGPGVAFIAGARVLLGSHRYESDRGRNVLPPHEYTTVRLDLSPDAPGFGELLSALPHTAIEIEVEYSDIAGRQRTWTVLSLRRANENNYPRVASVALYAADADGMRSAEPFVTSGPGAWRQAGM